MQTIKPIFTSLSPNVQKDDVLLALRLLLAPWTWKKGVWQEKFISALKEFLGAKHIFLFESGRTSLYAILSVLKLQSDDEVLLQAYTCVAVPDAVLWAGAKPVYIDCNSYYNMDAKDFEKKISKKSKVVIIQHTFGAPADIDTLIATAKKHNLFVIEDCAHALGSKYKNKPVGNFGDASFFSFGRDKVISSVFGGAVAVHNMDVAKSLQQVYDKCSYPSFAWIFQQLLHPIITVFAKATYSTLYVGKIIMHVVKKGRFLSRAVYETEKSGGRPPFFLKKMPNALAALALQQIEKLDVLNTHRKEIAGMYDKAFLKTPFVIPKKNNESESMYLRYTIRVKKAPDIIKKAKQAHIYLGDWYQSPIAPDGVDFKKLQYKEGSCPFAEMLALQSVNLPTSITVSKQDALRIVNFIKTKV